MAFSRSKNTDIVCNFLSMAVAILSIKSVNAMAVEYPSLKPYWFSNNNAIFSVYLFNLFSQFCCHKLVCYF